MPALLKLSFYLIFRLLESVGRTFVTGSWL